jgi:hypothetical protein
LLNVAFSNGSLKEPLPNSSAIFLVLAFAFLLPPITFAPTDCPSHRSLIPIQRFKNENLKIKISRITNPFSSFFIYKKRDERDGREKEERREPVEIKIKIRPSQLQMTITFN